MKFAVREFLRASQGSLISGSAGNYFESLSIDSRTLRPRAAFLAIRGPRFDGHAFLQAAADQGAAMLVIDRLDLCPAMPADRAPAIVQVSDVLTALHRFASFCRGRSQALVIGITGSNGKTTTKEMLACILRQAGPTLSTRGNLNNHIGLPLMLCELEAEHRYAIIEMGTSKKGDMELLVDLARPVIGVITNVGKDHLEFLDTPEGVLAENRLLFDRLPPSGKAIVNVDDPLLKPLAGKLACLTLTYGTDPEACVRVSDVRSDGETVRFEISTTGKSYPAQLATSGAFQALNAAAAAATAEAAGITGEHIVTGLARFRPVAMRMQTHTLSSGALLINDAYNANPSSVRVSIESFCHAFAARTPWVVLGDMRELGSLARDEHRDLGRWLAGQPLQKVFLYGRDTRFVNEALRQANPAMAVQRYQKKRDLIAMLKDQLQSHTPAILFKASRSMRLEQVISALLDGGRSGPRPATAAETAPH